MLVSSVYGCLSSVSFEEITFHSCTQHIWNKLSCDSGTFIGTRDKGRKNSILRKIMARKIYKHLITIMYLNAKYAIVFNVF